METQNITIALSRELLRKVKQLATERETSISALLAQTLRELVERDERYRAASERQLLLLQEGLVWGTEGRADWTRDELHAR